MSEGSQYLGMNAAEIAAHDCRAEHGHAPATPPAPQGEFSIGGNLWPGLSKLIEECGEVMQVAGKLIGSEGRTDHWSGDINKMLIEELGDLYAAMEFFVAINGLSRDAIGQRCDEKCEKFSKWHSDTQATRSAAV